MLPLSGVNNLRQWPPMQDGFSTLFASLNRNKRSVAKDGYFAIAAGNDRLWHSQALDVPRVVHMDSVSIMNRLWRSLANCSEPPNLFTNNQR